MMVDYAVKTMLFVLKSWLQLFTNGMFQAHYSDFASLLIGVDRPKSMQYDFLKNQKFILRLDDFFLSHVQAALI